VTGASALGPWPGTGVLEAQVAVLDLLADVPAGVEGMPHLVQLPARGPGAGSVGRTLALLEGMPAGLEPHGWRLRSTPDGELRRARAILREDLEALAAAAHGYAGPLVLPVLGPWSLAARVWLPRGDRLLADPVAVRDVVDSFVVGVREHVAEVRRRVPGAVPVVLVAEPALAHVLAGAVPTFSGRARLAAAPAGTVREALRRVVGGLGAALGAAAPAEGRDLGVPGAGPGEDRARAVAGAPAVVHVPAEPAALRVAAACEPGGVGLDVTGAGVAVWEGLAAAVEAGVRPWLGAVPVTDGPSPGRSSAAEAAAAVGRAWHDVGLERARLADVVVTPATGLAQTSPARAREVLRAVVDAGRDLAERQQA
jgi:hypothetical protein